VPRRRKTTGGKKYRLDFTGVDKTIRQRAKRIPEGDYLCKIVSAEERTSEKSNAKYLSWKFQVVSDSRGNTKHAGTPLWYITSLKYEALFNIRNLIYAATDGSKNVAGAVRSIQPDLYYGKQIGVSVEDDEYEGRVRSKAADVFPPSQLDAADDDEEEEDAEEEDEEEDEDEEEEDAEEDDEDDLDDVDDDDL